MALAEKNKQNKQKRFELLKIAIENESMLSNKMANFDNGINQVISDTRSLYEKRNDANFIKNDFRQKIFSLFANDPKDANEFIEKFNEDDILLFNSVYPQLKTTFANTFQSPQVVLNTAYQLMNNLDQTGVVNISSNNRQTRAILDNIDDIKNFLETEYQNNNLKKSNGDDMIHILDAIKEYEQFDFETFKLSSKWAVFKKNIQPFVNNIIEIMTNNENNNKIYDINSIFENVKQLLTDTISTFTAQDIEEIKAKVKEKEEAKTIANQLLDKNKAAAKITKAEAKNIAEQKIAEEKAEAKITKAANKAAAAAAAAAEKAAEAKITKAEEKERKKQNSQQVSNATTPQKKKK